MNLGDLNKVWEIKALKKPGEEEARKMLEKIAKQVQPIMRSRKWRVKVLSEFCPANPALLGLNVGGGVEVKLRLRRPRRDWDFFPYEQVLDTMLHELSHIVHGPHNADFYKLWDELRKECEDLVARGVTGTGQAFDLRGRRLGGFSHQPSVTSLRQVALAAAEKRQRVGSLLPSGPRRLGGDGDIMAALSPIQAAAMAAERRMQDDLWCGSCSGTSSIDDDPGRLLHESSNVTEAVRRNSIQSAKRPFNVIDQINSNTSVSSVGIGTARHDSIIDLSIPGPQSSYGSRLSGVIEPGSSSSYSAVVVDIQNEALWECSTCTLLNQPLSLVCEVCGDHKPKDAASKFKVWSCKFCTLENSINMDKCSACEQWRYSYGAPVSTRGPNIET